jgi:hypothetical protein
MIAAVPETSAAEYASCVKEHPLDDKLKKYLAELVKQHPSTIQFKTGAGHIYYDLLAHWPVIPGWENEAKELCDHLADMAYPLAARLYAQAVSIMVRIGSTPIVLPPTPATMAVYVTFDISRGVARCLFLSPHQTTPPSEEMAISSGVAMLCEPLHYHYHQLHEDRGQRPRHGTGNFPTRHPLNRYVDAPQIEPEFEVVNKPGSAPHYKEEPKPKPHHPELTPRMKPFGEM